MSHFFVAEHIAGTKNYSDNEFKERRFEFLKIEPIIVETSNYALSIYFLVCENIFLLKNYITTTRHHILAKPSGV